jgi:hypothetical protein
MELSDDICTALRILEKAVHAIDESVPEGESATQDQFSADALVVGPQCTWYQTPQHKRYDFRRRAAPKRILDRLVQQHLDSPGKRLEVYELIEAGWPDERIQSEAAENRLWVTLATLRKLGLREYIDKDEKGYCLDPSLQIERSKINWKQISAASS